MYLKSIFVVKDILKEYYEEEKASGQEYASKCAEVLNKTWEDMNTDEADPNGFKSINFKNEKGESKLLILL